jgi:phage tail sheath protein FI
MAAPGYDVTIIETPPSRPVAGATGTGFITAITERGPNGNGDGALAVAARSLDEWVSVYGGRVTYGYGYDAAECFFREGGRTLYTSRVVGAAAVNATGNIFDQSGSTDPGDVALVATAKYPGDYYNAVNAVVLVTADDASIPAGSFRIRVTHDTDGTLEESPDLADRAAAVAWADASSGYIDLAEGASAEDPRSQTTSLATGTDDHASIVEADWTAALDAFTDQLGPGQVAAPGRTTSAAHLALLAHARAAKSKRIARLDLADTAVVGTLTAAADAAGAVALDARWGGPYWPWAVVPGLVPGTTRTVPYSAIQMGLEARVDGSEGHSNQAAAGPEFGVSRFAIGLSQDPVSEAERETLDNAGINVVIDFGGAITTYGNRTLADKVTDVLWSQASGSREVMAVAAEAGAVLATFVHKQVDGKGHALGRLNGRIAAVCMRHYDLDALHGETPADAFIVDTESVNTPELLQAGQVSVALALRTSPGADRVSLQLVRRPITEAI